MNKMKYDNFNQLIKYQNAYVLLILLVYILKTIWFLINHRYMMSIMKNINNTYIYDRRTFTIYTV